MVQCKTSPTSPAINVYHLNEKYMNIKKDKTQEGRVQQGHRRRLGSPEAKRLLDETLSETLTVGSQNKWPSHGRRVDLHLQKVLYNNSTYAD